MKKILVIDDEEFIVKMITEKLQKNGYKTLTANDENEAVEAIRKGEPDLVITDIMMPFMGGFEVVEFVKETEALKNTPVIVLSGMDKETLEATATQADAIMTKPFKFEQLLEKVNNLLK